LVVVSVLSRLPCKFHGDVLVLFRAGYHGGIIGHNTRKVLCVLLINVPGRSHVIAPRNSYSDDYTCSCSYSCSRKLTGYSPGREL
jgi:hypothetical protein